MAPGTILLEPVLPPLAHRPDLWPQDSLQHLKLDVLVDSLSLIEPVEDDLAINDGGPAHQLLAAHHPALISDLRVLCSPVSLVLLVGSGAPSRTSWQTPSGHV